MNLPTIIGALLVAAIFITIVVRGHINKKQGKGGCNCNGGGDCGCCPGGGVCHPQK